MREGGDRVGAAAERVGERVDQPREPRLAPRVGRGELGDAACRLDRCLRLGGGLVIAGYSTSLLLPPPKSLFDNSPLRALIERTVDKERRCFGTALHPSADHQHGGLGDAAEPGRRGGRGRDDEPAGRADARAK